jgi:hypothetical protein
MTKGERLIWDLFMKVREVLPATAANATWATMWAAVFHEMEHPPPLEAKSPEPEHLAQPSADNHDDDTPHVRSAPKRKR